MLIKWFLLQDQVFALSWDENVNDNFPGLDQA